MPSLSLNLQKFFAIVREHWVTAEKLLWNYTPSGLILIISTIN